MPTEAANKINHHRSVYNLKPASTLITHEDAEEMRLRLKAKSGQTPAIENLPTASASPPPESSSLPAILGSVDQRVELSPYGEKGDWRTSLVMAFKEYASQRTAPMKKVYEEFVDRFNAGLLFPNIRDGLRSKEEVKKGIHHTISVKTLYRFNQVLESCGADALIPQYGGVGKSKVTDDEKNFLLTLLLHQSRLTVGYAITLLKEHFERNELESPSSPDTLRRYAKHFEREHYDLWILSREGEKALKDKVMPYAERDWRSLRVGQALVADGHRLNFQIKSPDDGKPCRAVLVLFWDWKSSYPVGWEIMMQESSQCVASALRNAILVLGKKPEWVYLDNGKVFKSKIFTEDSQFVGMFGRLGIRCHFAKPYNPQSKPVERIFRIMNEQVERLIPSYTGASVEDKPAWTRRNEKFALSLHDPYVPKVEEANEIIRAWRDAYAQRPSRGRDGLKPIDIFNAEKGPGVDPAELYYLMMESKERIVGRNGITWLGRHWYHKSLYGLKDIVVIRYSLFDLSQIYVFYKNELLCAATPFERIHPMASESENPKDMEAVKQVNRLQRKVENGTKKIIRLLNSRTAADIDWSRCKAVEAETIQKIEEARKPKVIEVSPFIEGVDYKNQQEPRPKYKPPKQWQGYYEYWERYEYHLKQDPGALSQEDEEFIAWYKQSDEFKRVYSIGPTRILSGDQT